MVVTYEPARRRVSHRAWAASVAAGAAAVLAAVPAARAQTYTYADWAEPVDGLWHDATKWSPATVPGVESLPTVTRISGTTDQPEYWVTLGTGPAVSLETLAIRTNGGLRIDGGTLSANTIGVYRGRLEVAGGALIGARVETSGGAFVVTGNSTLNQMMLAGTLRGRVDPATNRGPTATFRALAFDGGTLELGEMTAVFNAGDAGLTGTGEILFTPDPGYAGNRLTFSATTGTTQYPTIGEGITIRTAGDGGSIGRSTDIGTGTVWLTNYGTIAADEPVKVYVGGNFDNQGTLRATGGGTVDAAIGLGKSAGTLELATGGRIDLDGPRYYLDRAVTVSTGTSLELRGGWGNTAGITVDGGELLVADEPHTSSTVGTVTFAPGSGAGLRLENGVPLTHFAAYDTAADTLLGAHIYNTVDLAGAMFDLDDYVGTWHFGRFNFTNGTLTDANPQADYLPGTGHFMSTRDLRMQVPMSLVGDGWTAYSGTVIEAPVSIGEAGRLSLATGAAIAAGGSVVTESGGTLNLGDLAASGLEQVTMNGGILGFSGPATSAGVAALPISGSPDEYHVVTAGTLDLEGGTLRPTGGAIPWVLAGGAIFNGSIDAEGENGPLRVTSRSRVGDVTVTGRLLVDAASDSQAFIRLENGTTLRGATLDSVEPSTTQSGQQSRLAVDYGANVTLDAITLNATAAIASSGGLTRVVNGLTANADVTITSYRSAGLLFDGDQSVGGDGTLWLRSDGYSGTVMVAGTLTVENGLTVHASDLEGRFISALDSTGAMVNRGRILVDPMQEPMYPPPPRPPHLTVAVDHLMNDLDGRIEVARYGSLRIESPMENAGTVSVDAGGVLQLTGDLTLRETSRMISQLDAATADGGDALASVAGFTSLDGALSLDLFGDYMPALGEQFDLITTATATASVSGTFDSVEGVLPFGSGGGLALAVLYAGDGVDVLATLPGDADGDLDVDFFDFLDLRGSYGKEGVWAQGDFNGTGAVDFFDFLILRQYYGQGAAGGTAGWGEVLAFGSNVPEPATAGLLLMAGGHFLRRRR